MREKLINNTNKSISRFSYKCFAHKFGQEEDYISIIVKVENIR